MTEAEISLEDYQRDPFPNLGFRAFRIRFMRKVLNMQPNLKDPFHGKFQAKRLIQKSEWFTQFSVLYISFKKIPSGRCDCHPFEGGILHRRT